MTLDPDHCYEVMKARDARFDGSFYVGVSTTGVYCRPVCTVRTPGRDRCSFFANAASAEAAGFRPCLRCRPELAPGAAPVDAVARVLAEGAAAIELLSEISKAFAGDDLVAANRAVLRLTYSRKFLEEARLKRAALED